jgi:aminoglycoside 2'-N-acetyltransferase I
MAAPIEILDGSAGWPLAETLDRVCYPPEVMATVIWRDITWAHADKRIFAYRNGEPACHVGLYLRKARNEAREVFIGGIGGVMTLPAARHQGFASAAMRAAAEEMKSAGCDFGLLFCEPHNGAFYRGLGWELFAGHAFCDQPSGLFKFDMMNTMVLSVLSSPQSGTIDLCGLPW